jgi:hypothetical protein
MLLMRIFLKKHLNKKLFCLQTDEQQTPRAIDKNWTDQYHPADALLYKKTRFVGLKSGDLVNHEERNTTSLTRKKQPSENRLVKDEQQTPRARDKNWTDQYRRADALYKKTRFVGLKSGCRVYSWLDQARKKVSMYKKSMEDGMSCEEYDQTIANYSSSWSSARIKQVCHLVEAFKSGRTTHHSRGTEKGEGGRLAHAERHTFSMSTLSHARNRCSDDMNFFRTAIKLNCQAKCNNPKNQDLYGQLVTKANYRLSIGATRKNRGHYETGKKWCSVANVILKVTCFLRVRLNSLCLL